MKSVKKSPLEVLENKLYEFLCEKIRMGLPINGPLLIGQAQNIHAKITRNNPNPPKFEFLHFCKQLLEKWKPPISGQFMADQTFHYSYEI